MAEDLLPKALSEGNESWISCDSVFVTIWYLKRANGQGNLPYQESNNTDMYHAINLLLNVSCLNGAVLKIDSPQYQQVLRL
jgi:hypothetical protein